MWELLTIIFILRDYDVWFSFEIAESRKYQVILFSHMFPYQMQLQMNGIWNKAVSNFGIP